MSSLDINRFPSNIPSGGEAPPSNPQEQQEETAPKIKFTHELILRHYEGLNKDQRAEFIKEGILRSVADPKTGEIPDKWWISKNMRKKPESDLGPNTRIDVEEADGKPRMYYTETVLLEPPKKDAAGNFIRDEKGNIVRETTKQARIVVSMRNSTNPSECTFIVANCRINPDGQPVLDNSALLKIFTQAEYNEANYLARMRNKGEVSLGQELIDHPEAIPAEISVYKPTIRDRSFYPEYVWEKMSPEQQREAMDQINQRNSREMEMEYESRERAYKYLNQAMLSGDINNVQYNEHFKRIFGMSVVEMNVKIDSNMGVDGSEAQKHHQEVMDLIFGERYQEALETGNKDLASLIENAEQEISKLVAHIQETNTIVIDAIKDHMTDLLKRNPDVFETFVEKIAVSDQLGGIKEEYIRDLAKRLKDENIVTPQPPNPVKRQSDPEQINKAREYMDTLQGTITTEHEETMKELRRKYETIKQQEEEEIRLMKEKREALSLDQQRAVNEIKARMLTNTKLCEDPGRLIEFANKVGVDNGLTPEERLTVSNIIFDEAYNNFGITEQERLDATYDAVMDIFETDDRYDALRQKGVTYENRREFLHDLKEISNELGLKRKQRQYVLKTAKDELPPPEPERVKYDRAYSKVVEEFQTNDDYEEIRNMGVTPENRQQYLHDIHEISLKLGLKYKERKYVSQMVMSNLRATEKDILEGLIEPYEQEKSPIDLYEDFRAEVIQTIPEGDEEDDYTLQALQRTESYINQSMDLADATNIGIREIREAYKTFYEHPIRSEVSDIVDIFADPEKSPETNTFIRDELDVISLRQLETPDVGDVKEIWDMVRGDSPEEDLKQHLDKVKKAVNVIYSYIREYTSQVLDLNDPIHMEAYDLRLNSISDRLRLNDEERSYIMEHKLDEEFEDFIANPMITNTEGIAE